MLSHTGAYISTTTCFAGKMLEMQHPAVANVESIIRGFRFSFPELEVFKF